MCPLRLSEALEVPTLTATKSASSSVTHSQLPSEGLHMRWAEATEARCWARGPAFTLQDHVSQSEHTSGSGTLCTS